MGNRLTGQVSQRRQDLQKLSKEELIDLIMQDDALSGEDLLLDPPEPVASRPLDWVHLEWQAGDYTRLPAGGELSSQSTLQAPWRVVFTSYVLAHPVVGIELVGDIVIGRASDGVAPDLDLTSWNAFGYGISREHALMRPTNEDLQLMDLGTINGSRLNGALLRAREPVALQNHDIITFGTLKFQIRIVESPN